VRGRGRAANTKTAEPRESRRVRFDSEAAFSLGIVLVLALALWKSFHFGLHAGLFPWAVIAPVLVLASVQAARDLTGRGGRSTPPDLVDGVPDVPPDVAGRRTAEMAAWIVGMFVAIWLVGFAAATLLTTFFYLKVGARERWGTSIALSFVGFVFVYGLFERALSVPFPPGALSIWFGHG
jgi:hypothetical protein